jgi:adenylylsulfate kinase-like enzyme
MRHNDRHTCEFYRSDSRLKPRVTAMRVFLTGVSCVGKTTVGRELIDSNLIEKHLTAEEKRLYLREIKKDITYFRKTYERAHLRIDISDLDPKQAARRVKEAVDLFERSRREPGKGEQPGGG